MACVSQNDCFTPATNCPVYGDTDNTLLQKIANLLCGSAFNSSGPTTGGSTNVTGSSFTSINDANVAVAGTRVQFSAQPTPRGVLIVAKLTNTNPVYIGGSGVTNASGGQKGITLTQAGMPSIVLPVQNTNQIYINADTAGDGVGVVIL